ncbi:MAG TPA: LLM class flavin-dependent oxidoreductase [Solirubrobacteraceae bacterium]
MAAQLSIRVGVGWSPFDGDGLADGRFWRAIDTMEELGYDSIWLSDTATLGGVAPLPTLAAIAARTEHLKLGIGVLVMPPRNPVLLARELATVDVISGGRLLPAGGLGIQLRPELAAMGVPREERTARLEEGVRVVKMLWPGEPVTFKGRFTSLTEMRLRPRPTRPKLEFWLGGRAPAALRRVGRIADGWLGSFVGPGEFAAMVDVIRGAAAEAGRSIDEDHYGTTVFAAPAEEELFPRAQRLLSRRPELAREDHIAYGTDELRRLLERFKAEGASKFVVTPIARDMLPWLRELHAEAVAPVEAAA